MAGGANPHRRIERRALVGTAKATPKARTSNKRKVKSNTQSFLSANVCLDNADLFIHGQKLLTAKQAPLLHLVFSGIVEKAEAQSEIFSAKFFGQRWEWIRRRDARPRRAIQRDISRSGYLL